MPQKPLTDGQCIQALTARANHTNDIDAATSLGLTRGAFENRIRVGIQRGLESAPKPVTQSSPRILFLDIETRPIVAEVWKLYGVDHIGLNQVREFSGTICVGAMFGGEKKVSFFSDWQHGHKGMLEAIRDMWERADAICGYNSDRFDLRKLKGEFIQHGIGAGQVKPVASIDVFKTVKREFAFDSNKLQHIANLLGVGSKLQHEGHGLWMKAVYHGDPKAQRMMERYCKQDVKLLERVYLKLLPWISTHPYLGTSSGYSCNRCGSRNLIFDSEKRTRHFRIQNLKCGECGGWRQGLRKKIA